MSHQGCVEGNKGFPPSAGNMLLSDAHVHGLPAATFCFSEMERGFDIPQSLLKNNLFNFKVVPCNGSQHKQGGTPVLIAPETGAQAESNNLSS